MSNVNLIVGIPGAGKTALLIDLLLREVIPHNRPIFIDQRADIRTGELVPSIPGLNIPHTMIPDARKWHEEGVLPDGACLVLDEVQDIWPVAASGAKPTADLLAMNRVRHRGITIYCTSQRPSMVHAHVRGLVGRYILLRNLGLLGRRLYEWTEFPEHPLHYKDAPQQKRYTLPKRVFDLYKSSALHVKHKITVPKAVIVAGLGALALAGIAWYGYKSISGKVDKARAGAGASGPTGTPGTPREAAGEGYRPSPGRVRVLNVSPPVKQREPYAGLGMHLAGVWEQGGQTRASFTASVDGKAVATLRDVDLQKAGYAWRLLGPCSAVLIFGDRERAVTCDTPVLPPAARGPAAPASAAT